MSRDAQSHGDYLSDALAAQVWRDWHRARRQHHYITGHPFSKPPRTAPKYANQDKVNPGSVIFVRLNDVPLHGLERTGRFNSERIKRGNREQTRDLRFRAAHEGATRSNVRSSAQTSRAHVSSRDDEGRMTKFEQ